MTTTIDTANGKELRVYIKDPREGFRDIPGFMMSNRQPDSEMCVPSWVTSSGTCWFSSTSSVGSLTTNRGAMTAHWILRTKFASW